MRIATYNLWNSESGMPDREQYIVDEIMNVDADVICLQEVLSKAHAERIADKTEYKHCFFAHYINSEEGLCILSNCPFEKRESWLAVANAVSCSVKWDERIVAIVNLHLPWDSVIEREKQIVDIIKNINEEKYDYVFLAGDFNCNDTSDVHRFLTGDCLLKGQEANPVWYDLAAAYAELTHTEPESTLNFRENPRFLNNTIELNARFDRILLRNTYPVEFPVLKKCSVFGKTIFRDIKLSASDHYGVAVDVELR